MDLKFYRFLIVLLVVAGLFGCASHTKKVNPLPNIKSTKQISSVWHTSVGDGTGGYFMTLNPASYMGSLYVPSYNGELKSINPKTGSEQWSVKFKQHLTSGVGSGRGGVFVGSEEGVIFALGATSGKILWKTQLSNEILARPHYSNGKVFVKSQDGTVYALNSHTGKILWSHSEKLPSLILRGSSEPQTSGSIVYVGFANGRLVALSEKTGRLLWRYQVASGNSASPISKLVDLDDQPIVSRGTVYVASYQGYLVAVNASSGRLLWRQKISSYSGIALNRRAVFLTDESGKVLAFSRNSGSKLWVQGRLTTRELTGPKLFNGNLLAVADQQGYVHILNAGNGRIVARYRVGSSPVFASPVRVGNDLVVYSQDGRVSSLKIS